MKFNLKIEDIKYIKITYKDSSDNLLSLKAGVKKIDFNKIISTAKYEEDLYVKTPQKITIDFVCKDGLYKGESDLLLISKEEPYIFVSTTIPDEIEYFQNREYFRVPAIYDCIYSVNNDEIQTFRAKTVDISANGVNIFLYENIIPEKDAYLTLLINEKEIRTRISYVRSVQVENGYNLSFYFSQISVQDRDLISQECIKKQLELKRKSIE